MTDDDDGLYRRPNSKFWWCSYQVGTRQVRESTKTANRVAAAKYLSARKREVKLGAWEPQDRRRSSMPTVQQFIEEFLQHRKDTKVLTWKDEANRLRSYVAPHIGKTHLDEVRPMHIKEMMTALANSPNSKGEPHSPRSLLHIYGATRLMFDEALSRELILATPCTLRTKRGELPVKRDKDPRWRPRHNYTREEVELLISDERVKPLRRVFYGLLLLAGLRSGEAIGLRWSDYDRSTKPLGQLLVATQYDNADLKVPGSTRLVPVHRELARLLAEWRLEFPTIFGRDPRPDDFLVPSPQPYPNGELRHLSKKTLEWLKEDLEMLGLRSTGRGRHAMRHTFISLCQADGAPRDILETITHEGTDQRAIAGYTTYPWEALCEAVGKLNVCRRDGQVVKLPITFRITHFQK